MGRAYQNRKVSMAKTSDMNARVYSKHSRSIYVCAKSGGIDPEGNLALRSLIERAKREGQNISSMQILDWMKQTANGLKCLHSNHIIHRNIKPE